MSTVTLPYRFTARGGLAADVIALNEIPLRRELIVELDTQKFKVGDGVTAYVALPYWGGGGGGGGPASAWLVGTGVPGSGLGVDGDMYLNEANSDVYQKLAGTWVLVANIKGDDAPPAKGQILFGAGDRSNAIALGLKASVPVTFAGTLLSMQMVLSTNDGLAGSLIVDIWKCDYATYAASRPDITDTITAAATPSISGGFKTQDAALTGWTTSFAAGDVFVASVIARSLNVAHFSLALLTEKTP